MSPEGIRRLDDYFSQGLVAITNRDERGVTHLPERGVVMPSDAQVEEYLSKLTEAPTRDSQVLKFVRPNVANMEVFTPAQFRNTFNQARKYLKGKSYVNKNVKELADFLDTIAEKELEQIEEYRKALLRG